jgi:predicted alpha/beta-fold hydrolase
MPVIKESTYQPPFLLKNGHLQTIYPSLFRKFDTSFYKRERISTPDDDFLDLDWSRIGSEKIAIISHGLEGNSQRSYVVGMVKALNQHGWDALAWNFRGCSGEINRQLRFYHSGSTDDLDCVINRVLKQGKYKSLVLIGFSMGGNLSLVYLGQKGSNINPLIKKAVVFSVPCDLAGSSYQIAKPMNRMYLWRFLRMLHEKVKTKMTLFPGQINDDNYSEIKSFRDFDNRYTAPIHSFTSAEDYWDKCSSKQFICKIQIPTLIVNAGNDPFLSPSCYPLNETSISIHVFLEIPKSGGHVGFVEFNQEKMYWSEKRALQFLADLTN